MSIVFHRAFPLVMAAMTASLSGCADGTRGTEPIARTPTQPLVAGVRGTVDGVAGTLTFEPLPPAHTSGAAVRLARIYGDQDVTVRLYNSPVTVTNPSSPGKKTFSANVGLQNLLAFPIGDEQAGPTPADTMGIYVFVTSGPTVTTTSSPCSPACTVTAQNHHGTLAFDAVDQRYWHWGERVGAVGGGDDTTRARKTWIFEADTQVTGFRFEVLVSAGWAPPNDTRWKIDYPGDSVPNTGAEPRWTHSPFGPATTFALSTPPGVITIATPAGGRLTIFQTDSLNTNTNAYIEARLQMNIPTTGPEVSFGLDDQVKFIAAGVSGTRAGFMTGTGSFTFLPGSVLVTTTTFHTYRMRKFGADSVVLWVDGVRRLARVYGTFPARLAGSSHGFYFGPLGTGASAVSAVGNSSSWDYVIFEIGVTQP